jgi:RNA polymerase sigma-70 factor (ECF subfamily)
VSQEAGRYGASFEQLLDAARAGGDWAWREIYEGLSPLVFGYIRGRGAKDPEDLLGEVFLQVVRKIQSFTGGEDEFRAWVLTIARRRVIDDYRRRSARPQIQGGTDDLEDVGPTGDVEREAVASLEAAGVLAAIRELTPDQQDVLLLRVVGDLTLEDVARVLGKRLNAVKALQHRAHAALAKKISKEAVSL